MEKISDNQHQGTILALDINPSLDGHFCSAGNKGELNIWKIPEDFLEEGYAEIKVKQKKKKLTNKILPFIGSAKLHDDEINSVCWLNST